MKDRSKEMTLRDMFACFALEGMIAHKGFKDRGARGRAVDAYMAADGMLEARQSSREILLEERKKELNDEAVRKIEEKELEMLEHMRRAELIEKMFKRSLGPRG
jgi:hypothetical protein